MRKELPMQFESLDTFSKRTGLHVLEVPTPFLVGPVNVFLLKRDDEPLTLVDAGCLTDECHDALVAALAGHGVAYEDIERIILTHHHVDHTGLLARIMHASGAEAHGHPHLVIESQLGNRRDDEQKDFYYNVMREFGVPGNMAEDAMSLWDMFRHLHQDFSTTHTFTDGGTSGPFKTYFVPGHSSTDTLLVNEAEAYTIVGDHILERFNPNPLLRRPINLEDPRPHALVEYQASLARSRELGLGYCLPGHGDPIPDHRAAISGILAKHELRNKRILDTLPESGYTPYQVAQFLYPEIALHSLYLGLSVATGQLEVMENAGALRSEIREGIVHYLAP